MPIVPGAILYDLGVGNRPDVWPTADCGYRAAAGATSRAVEEGNVGAGAGATIGKTGGGGAMKGGLGTASISVPSGADTLIVGAIVAVNAVGDVIDPQQRQRRRGRPHAGRKRAGRCATVAAKGHRAPVKPGQNTTIGVVATNARLTKVQATKVAQMAHDGFARAIYPAHTMGDGDAIFALATGAIETGDVSRIGALAADAMVEAILRAVRAAKSIPGYPAAQDIQR